MNTGIWADSRLYIGIAVVLSATYVALGTWWRKKNIKDLRELCICFLENTKEINKKNNLENRVEYPDVRPGTRVRYYSLLRLHRGYEASLADEHDLKGWEKLRKSMVFIRADFERLHEEIKTDLDISRVAREEGPQLREEIRQMLGSFESSPPPLDAQLFLEVGRHRFSVAEELYQNQAALSGNWTETYKMLKSVREYCMRAQEATRRAG